MTGKGGKTWKTMQRTIALAAAVLLCAPPAAAEIREKIKGGEVVATNIRIHPRVPGAAAGAGPRAAGAKGREVTAPPGIARLLVDTASRYGFDPALIRAVVLAESSFDPMAVSRKGARGLMQLMPSTAKRFGVEDVHDPGANLEAGVAYLRELALRYEGNMTLALAAYNAGPEAVDRYGGVPPYEETLDYLAAIRKQYGTDLGRGDWSGRETDIRLAAVDSHGTPVFTNLRRRRIIMVPESRPAAAGGRGARKTGDK